VRGETYRVRYRAQNFNGWGPYSAIGYIKAATVPGTPPAPLFVSSAATSLTLQFIPPDDNGGSTISSYKLSMDTIQATPSFSVIYSGTALSVTLTTADGLVTGTTYRFILQAVNAFGDSDASEETRVALGRVPT